MLKRSSVAATAAAVFGVGTLALANGVHSINLVMKNTSGFYIRGEGSYSFPDSKEGTSTTIYGNNEDVDTYSFIPSKNQGPSGRFAIGYNFNTRLGVETGANFIHSLQKFLLQQEKVSSSIQNENQYLTNIIFHALNLDLLGTVTFCSQNNFYAFAKGGVVYLQIKTSNKEPENGEKRDDGKSTHFKSTYYNDYFRPKVAVGIGYNISKHVSADISLSRIFGNGTQIVENYYLPSVNFTTFAVNYKF